MSGARPPGSAAGRWERTAADTSADDCAEGFLGELDEVLWLLRECERTDANTFRHAVRKSDHVTELRRLLHRLHTVLVCWEAELSPGG